MKKTKKTTRAKARLLILPVLSLLMFPFSVKADELQYFADSAGQYHNVDPELIKAVVKVESGGEHYNKAGKVIVSPKGALGRMQLMPGTAADMQVDPRDPWANIYGGTKYLRRMLDLYNGDLRLALAAYNAGPGRVKNGKVPSIPETQYYVELVIYYYNWFKAQAQPSASPVVVKRSAPAVFWVAQY